MKRSHRMHPHGGWTGLFRGSATLGAMLIAGASASGQATTARVSLDSAGGQGDAGSWWPDISGDGRYVVFQSEASNLVPGDTNDRSDVFVHDRQTGVTERVSVDSSGNQGNDTSYFGNLSGDGRYVVFLSHASNLVPGDTNGFQDVFVHDRQTGVTELVSVDSSGNQGNQESGGYYDAATATISLDGRYVAFESSASNLVAGDTNFVEDVFVHDRQTGVTQRVSVSSSGTQGNLRSIIPDISVDGRYVAFASDASNLVSIDLNGTMDVFVYDRLTGAMDRASISSFGGEGNSASNLGFVSGDGRFVAFESTATNLVAGDINGFGDVFVRDRLTGVTQLISKGNFGALGNGDSLSSSISPDGRFVALTSEASTLVGGDTNDVPDAFLYDSQTSQIERINLDSFGNEANAGPINYSSASTGLHDFPAVSDNGLFVAFTCSATNLVAGDTNGFDDVFVRDRSDTIFINYCTPGYSYSNCAVVLDASGVPSATAAAGFLATAPFVEGQKDGLFFYGQNGQQATPWGNGTSLQCVAPPVKRGTLQAGNGTVDRCDGLISQDLNALWCPTCPKPNHAPIPGRKLQLQFWYRDPKNTSNQTTSLSDAVEADVYPYGESRQAIETRGRGWLPVRVVSLACCIGRARRRSELDTSADVVSPFFFRRTGSCLDGAQGELARPVFTHPPQRRSSAMNLIPLPHPTTTSLRRIQPSGPDLARGAAILARPARRRCERARAADDGARQRRLRWQPSERGIECAVELQRRPLRRVREHRQQPGRR